MYRTTRRTLVRSIAQAGVAAATVPAGLWPRVAQAQTAEKPALLVVFLAGGHNAVFASADSFAAAGTFGVTANNQRSLGNGLVVDAPTFGTLPAFALEHMATVGVRHGIRDHGGGQNALMADGTRSYALRLAAAMGGDASIKCANMGTRRVPGVRPPENGVSMQAITDMRSTIEALGGGTDATAPDRAIAAQALTSSYGLSTDLIAQSPVLTRPMEEGYQAVIETLRQPVKTFSFPDLAMAYGLANNSTVVNNFASQLAGAELMITAGANVVYTSDGGWDSHGDRTATTQRNMMTQRILPPLRTFLNRMLNAPGRNVVVAMISEFSRSLPGSDHAAALSATVMGKYVKVGTTGKMTANVQLPMGTPSVPGLWAYLARQLNVAQAPFGPNPHTTLVL